MTRSTATRPTGGDPQKRNPWDSESLQIAQILRWAMRPMATYEAHDKLPYQWSATSLTASYKYFRIYGELRGLRNIKAMKLMARYEAHNKLRSSQQATITIANYKVHIKQRSTGRASRSPVTHEVYRNIQVPQKSRLRWPNPWGYSSRILGNQILPRGQIHNGRSTRPQWPDLQCPDSWIPGKQIHSSQIHKARKTEFTVPILIYEARSIVPRPTAIRFTVNKPTTPRFTRTRSTGTRSGRLQWWDTEWTTRTMAS